MIRSITKDITAGNLAEVLDTFFTGQSGKTQKVVGIAFQPVADTWVRLYLDQDRICEVAGDCWGVAAGMFPVNLEVPDGQAVKAGWYNYSGGSVTQAVTVFYEED